MYKKEINFVAPANLRSNREHWINAYVENATEEQLKEEVKELGGFYNEALALGYELRDSIQKYCFEWVSKAKEYGYPVDDTDKGKVFINLYDTLESFDKLITKVSCVFMDEKTVRECALIRKDSVYNLPEDDPRRVYESFRELHLYIKKCREEKLESDK